MYKYLNSLTKLVLSIIASVYLQTGLAVEPVTLAPGQIIIDFQAENEVSLFTFKAQKIKVLNQLANHVAINLIVDSELKDPISITISKKPLAHVLIQLLGDENHIVWFTRKPTTKSQIVKLRIGQSIYKSEFRKVVKPDTLDSASIARQTTKNQINTIELFENLGDLNSIGSIRQLKQILKHANIEQKIAICNSLSDIGTSKAVGLLSTLVRDNSASVVKEAIYALGDIGTGYSAKVLTIAIKNPNETIQALAISELAQIKSIESVAALHLAITHQNQNLRLLSVKALGELNMKSSNQLLWQLTNSDDMQISAAAIEILNRLNRQSKISHF